jgi:hypothetical protein
MIKKSACLSFFVILALVLFVMVMGPTLRRTENFDDGDPFISIVTMRKYKDALAHVLASLPAGFTKYIVTYQDEPVEEDYYEQKEDGHYEIYSKRNLFEYGAWPALSMLKRDGKITDSDKILMIHDTTKLGENTLEKVKALDFKDFDIFWASDVGQCNLCVALGKIIEKGAEKFKDMLTLDRGVGIAMEWDHTHEKSLKNIEGGGVKNKFYDKQAEHRGTRKVYSEVDRNVLYFESIDLEKYYVHVALDGKGHPTVP